MCSNEIDKFGILDLLILSSESDPVEKMETINNAAQCIIIEKNQKQNPCGRRRKDACGAGIIH